MSVAGQHKAWSLGLVRSRSHPLLTQPHATLEPPPCPQLDRLLASFLRWPLKRVILYSNQPQLSSAVDLWALSAQLFSSSPRGLRETPRTFMYHLGTKGGSKFRLSVYPNTPHNHLYSYTTPSDGAVSIVIILPEF